jgi:hypothetical protein
MKKRLKQRCGSDRENSSDICATGFDALVMRWNMCISVGGRYVEKWVFFFVPVSNITCFTFYVHLWLIYWLSLVCITILNRLAGDRYYRYSCLAVDGPLRMNYRPAILKCHTEMGFGPATFRVRWKKWVELNWIYAQCSTRKEDFLLASLHESPCRGLSTKFCISDLRFPCPWAFR